MLLSNRLIYEDKLKCGSEKVAQQRLVLPRQVPCGEVFDDQATCPSDTATCWIQDLMTEDIKAAFVDTDEVPAYDSKIGDLVHNETEARLVYQVRCSEVGDNSADVCSWRLR